MVSVGGIDLYIVHVHYTIIFKLSQERFSSETHRRNGVAVGTAKPSARHFHFTAPYRPYGGGPFRVGVRVPATF